MTAIASARQVTAGALALTLLLGGCQQGGRYATGPSGAGDTGALGQYASAEDDSGGSYAEDYAVQAGLGGLAIGAGIGCLVGKALADNCAAGALLGALVGGVGGALFGSSLGRQTEDLADQQVTAEQALAAADRELVEAQQARLDAEIVVANEQNRLRGLRLLVIQGQASRRQLSEAVEQARIREAQIGGARNRLTDAISDVSQRIHLERQRGGVSPQLIERRNQLAQERDLLDQQLSALVTDIDASDAMIS